LIIFTNKYRWWDSIVKGLYGGHCVELDFMVGIYLESEQLSFMGESLKRVLG